MQNYMRYKLQGGRMFLKKDVVPHIFHCQKSPTPPRMTGERRRRREIISGLMDCQPSSHIGRTGSSFKVENSESEHFSPVCENELQYPVHKSLENALKIKEEKIDSDYFSPVQENELQASQSPVDKNIENILIIKEETIDSDHFSPVCENERQYSVHKSLENAVKIKAEKMDSDYFSPVQENELQASQSPVDKNIENVLIIKEETIESDDFCPVRENEDMIHSNHFSFICENELQSSENKNTEDVLNIEEEEIDSEHFNTARENNELPYSIERYNLVELFTFKKHSNYSSESTYHQSSKSNDIRDSSSVSDHEFHGNKNKRFQTGPVVLNRRQKQIDYWKNKKMNKCKSKKHERDLVVWSRQEEQIDCGKNKKRQKHKNEKYETDPIVLSRRQKQIDYGKNTKSYKAYLKAVPKQQRVPGKHISTPQKHLIFSRRSWDSQIKIWRKRLHEYDPKSEDEDDNEVDLSGVITIT